MSGPRPSSVSDASSRRRAGADRVPARELQERADRRHDLSTSTSAAGSAKRTAPASPRDRRGAGAPIASTCATARRRRRLRVLDPLGLVLKAGVWYLLAQRRGRARVYRYRGSCRPANAKSGHAAARLRPRRRGASAPAFERSRRIEVVVRVPGQVPFSARHASPTAGSGRRASPRSTDPTTPSTSLIATGPRPRSRPAGAPDAHRRRSRRDRRPLHVCRPESSAPKRLRSRPRPLSSVGRAPPW